MLDKKSRTVVSGTRVEEAASATEGPFTFLSDADVTMASSRPIDVQLVQNRFVIENHWIKLALSVHQT